MNIFSKGLADSVIHDSHLKEQQNKILDSHQDAIAGYMNDYLNLNSSLKIMSTYFNPIDTIFNANTNTTDPQLSTILDSIDSSMSRQAGIAESLLLEQIKNTTKMQELSDNQVNLCLRASLNKQAGSIIQGLA